MILLSNSLSTEGNGIAHCSATLFPQKEMVLLSNSLSTEGNGIAQQFSYHRKKWYCSAILLKQKEMVLLTAQQLSNLSKKREGGDLLPAIC